MRLKSLDICRGLIIIGMIFAHLRDWWLREEDLWFRDLSRLFLDRIFAPGFLLASGISLVIWFRLASIKANELQNYSLRIMKKEYYFRGLVLLIIAFIYNCVVAIVAMDPTWIWSWFILFSLAFSMLMTGPFLNTSKLFRLIYIIFIIIINQILITYLWPYEGQLNSNGILFYILYNKLILDPILISYAFYLMGTIIGDILYEAYQIEDLNKRRKAVRNRFLIPSFILSTILIIFGVVFLAELFWIDYPFSWLPFSIAGMLIAFSIFVTFEVYGYLGSKKSYRFSYYFSYYSLTVYLAHNILFFLFFRQLTLIYFFIAFTITILIIGFFILKPMHRKWGSKFALKVIMGKIAIFLALKIEHVNLKALLEEFKALNVQR